jgi:hypothetical protein
LPAIQKKTKCCHEQNQVGFQAALWTCEVRSKRSVCGCFKVPLIKNTGQVR